MILGPDFNFRNFHLLLLLLQTSSSAAAGRFESLSHLEHKQKDEREDESIERRCMLLKVGNNSKHLDDERSTIQPAMMFLRHLLVA